MRSDFSQADYNQLSDLATDLKENLLISDVLIERSQDDYDFFMVLNTSDQPVISVEKLEDARWLIWSLDDIEGLPMTMNKLHDVQNFVMNLMTWPKG